MFSEKCTISIYNILLSRKYSIIYGHSSVMIARRTSGGLWTVTNRVILSQTRGWCHGGRPPAIVLWLSLLIKRSSHPSYFVSIENTTKVCQELLYGRVFPRVQTVRLFYRLAGTPRRSSRCGKSSKHKFASFDLYMSMSICDLFLIQF